MSLTDYQLVILSHGSVLVYYKNLNKLYFWCSCMIFIDLYELLLPCKRSLEIRNACRNLLIRSDVYTTYRLTLNLNVCRGRRNIYSMIFVKYAMLHPLDTTFQTEEYTVTSSVNHQSCIAYQEQYDIGMRLPTNWLVDHNSIACFVHESPSQPCIDRCCFGHYLT